MRNGQVDEAPLETVDLETFQTQLAQAGNAVSVGVELSPSDDVEALASVLTQAPIIRLTFPKFREGRPYSQARLLRSRLGYKGLIIASGPLIPDQGHFLWRVGFSGVEVEKEATLPTWRENAKRFETYHQPAVSDRL